MSDEDEVRRLLADARHTDPIPPDVAARMDGVIADLRADRPVPATVTDLAAARRRRRTRTLLVAAAAVVVAGIGIDQLRGAGLGGAGSSADSSSAGSSVTDGEQAAPDPRDFAAGPVVRLAPDRFARQVARLQSRADRDDLDRVTRSDAQAGSAGGGRLYQHLAGSARCSDPGRGRVVPVRYDGAPGLLVYRPVTGDTQVVDLILCGHSGITRTITLTAR